MSPDIDRPKLDEIRKSPQSNSRRPLRWNLLNLLQEGNRFIGTVAFVSFIIQTPHLQVSHSDLNNNDNEQIHQIALNENKNCQKKEDNTNEDIEDEIEDPYKPSQPDIPNQLVFRPPTPNIGNLVLVRRTPTSKTC